MKEPWEWKEGDLQAFVDNGAIEALDLDFKACEALDVSTPRAREKSRLDLTKDVSAFANSAGGTLVYGIIEDKKTHQALRLDGGYDPAVVNHEWIGQVINSIQQRISDVRIHPVHLEKHSPGRVAYVVHVPASATAHQSSDYRYYKRYNFESVPMADYEIRDVMNRAGAPKLRVEIVYKDKTEGSLRFAPSGDLLASPALEVYVVNEDVGDVAEYLQIHLFMSNVGQDLGGLLPSTTKATHYIGGITYLRLEYSVGRQDVPLFPGERRRMGACDVRVLGESRSMPLPLLLWRVRASRSMPQHGAVNFECIDAESWEFRNVTIADLERAGYSVEFAP